MTHLHMWTVTMASIVTVWTTWHAAMSSPARSIAFRCAWHPLLSLWAACDGGEWVAIDDGARVHLIVVSMCEHVICVSFLWLFVSSQVRWWQPIVLGALLSMVAVYSLGSWLGIATSSLFSLLVVVSGRL